MDKQRVSIIMGVFNCEKTLSDAIDSILQQSYKSWKLILCDDGSTDNTYAVAKEYADKYPNIELYFNKANMGLNYTLNHCLKYADTEYVARMDGDDISMPDRLEKEVEFLDTHPEFAFVSTAMVSFDEKGEWGIYRNVTEPIAKDFLKRSPFCHAPCMIRRDVYDEVGGYSVNRKLLRVEDLDLWLKIYEKGYLGYNLQEPLYKMRDDRNARNRRKYRYRFNEAYVRRQIIKKLRLPFVYNIYVVRPLIIGLIPSNFYDYLHKKTLQK